MQENMIDQIQKKYFDHNLPWVVHWELVYGCNLKCQHCYTFHEEKKNYLSVPQMAEIIRQLKEMGTLFLTLSGGEPFVRDDIMDIIEMVRKDFFVIILSNATLIDSFKAKRLKDLKVTQVEISLYAMDEKIHDSITGIKGSHTQTMEGIHRLKEEGVSVRIKCTIMEQNYAEYTKIGDFSKKLGIRFSSSPVVSPRLDGSQDTYKYCTETESLRSYFLQWGKENKEKYKDFKEPLPLDRSFICSAGRTSCAITPDGYLKPCTMLPIKLGNLLEKSFRELWQDRPKRFVEDIRGAKMSDFSKCKDCKWSYLCSPCPGLNYLETGNMFNAAEGYCNKVKSIINGLDIERSIGNIYRNQ